MELPDFENSPLNPNKKNFLKTEFQCQKKEFKGRNPSEKIIKIESPDDSDTIFLASNSNLYKITDPDFDIVLVSSNLLGENEEIQSIQVASINTLIIITTKNFLIKIQNFEENEEKKSIKKILKLKNEPLDSPQLVSTNGEFTIIREIEFYTKTKIYTIFNASDPEITSIHQIQPIFEKNDYCHALNLNNTLIFFGKNGHHMVYKTDIEGFIRTEALQEDNLIGMAYLKDQADTFVKYYIEEDSNSKTTALKRKSQKIKNIALTCSPNVEYITLFKHKLSSKFLTFLKKKEENGYVAHEITWINRTNKYGFFALILLSFFIIFSLISIVKGIINSKKDNRLIEEIKGMKLSVDKTKGSSFKGRVTEFFGKIGSKKKRIKVEDLGSYESFGDNGGMREASQSWDVYKENKKNSEHRYIRNKSEFDSKS